MNHSAQVNSRTRTLAKLLLPLGLMAFPLDVVLADDDAAMGWFVPKDSAAKNFYGGVSLGVNSNDYPDSNQDGSVTGVNNDESGVDEGVFMGYQFNDNVAVEGGYHDFGKSDFSGTSSGGPSWAAGPVSATNEANSWDLGVMGRWPITDRWYALGFLGWSWWESKETFVEGSVVTVETDSGSDAAYALGFEYDIGLQDRIVYRFMGAYHRVDDSGYDIASGAAEIVYIFP